MGEAPETLLRHWRTDARFDDQRKEGWLIAIDSPGMARGLARSRHENGKDRVLRLRSENILE